MDRVIDPQCATRKGIIIGVVATLIVLGVGVRSLKNNKEA